MFHNFFPTVEVMWRNMVEPERPQMTIQQGVSNLRTGEATNTHSEYVILLLLHGNNGYPNPPHCYITRTLPVLLSAGKVCFIRKETVTEKLY